MLNQTEFKTVSGNTRKIILVDEKNSTAVSCKVANTGIDADDDGKKIAKAGTPLVGDLLDRDTAFTVAGVSDTANCVLLHDVDVTSGTKNAQAVIFGTIDLSKLEVPVQALITSKVMGDLKMVQFIK